MLLNRVETEEKKNAIFKVHFKVSTFLSVEGIYRIVRDSEKQ